MKTTGMIFNGNMVRALLDGRKTQTRRPVKPPKQWADQYSHCDPFAMPPAVWWWNGVHDRVGVRQESPYGYESDLIWVRETFCHVDDTEFDGTKWVDYRATPAFSSSHPAGWDNEPDSPDALKWRPSIHMPRWASRLTLRITDVRVERLQNISGKDAIAEGIQSISEFGADADISYYSDLWDYIYGTWKENPWVWVYEFEVIRQNVDTVIKQMEKEKC